MFQLGLKQILPSKTNFVHNIVHFFGHCFGNNFVVYTQKKNWLIIFYLLSIYFFIYENDDAGVHW